MKGEKGKKTPRRAQVRVLEREKEGRCFRHGVTIRSQSYRILHNRRYLINASSDFKPIPHKGCSAIIHISNLKLIKLVSDWKRWQGTKKGTRSKTPNIQSPVPRQLMRGIDHPGAFISEMKVGGLMCYIK